MTIEHTTTITVHDITAIVLECRHCGNGIKLRGQPDDEKQEFLIESHQQCPACGKVWWGYKNLDDARGRPATPPPSPSASLVKAIRGAINDAAATVDVKLVVSVPETERHDAGQAIVR